VLWRLRLRIILRAKAHFNFEKDELRKKKSLDGDFQGLSGQETRRALEHLPQNVLQNSAVMVVGDFFRRIRPRDCREGLYTSVF